MTRLRFLLLAAPLQSLGMHREERTKITRNAFLEVHFCLALLTFSERPGELSKHKLLRNTVPCRSPFLHVGCQGIGVESA